MKKLNVLSIICIALLVLSACGMITGIAMTSQVSDTQEKTCCE